MESCGFISVGHAAFLSDNQKLYSQYIENGTHHP